MVFGFSGCGASRFSVFAIRLRNIPSAVDVQMTIGKGKRPRDTNQLAKWIVDQSTGLSPDPDAGKNPAAVALGRLGGLKGGNARASQLSARKRKDIAQKAAAARWNPSK
jgi:hypothetical protein